MNDPEKKPISSNIGYLVNGEHVYKYITDPETY